MVTRPRRLSLLAALVLPAIAVPLAAASPPAPLLAQAAATCLGQEATITASDRDRVAGTAGADVIVAHDVGQIDARAGDDLICATTSGSDASVEVWAGGGDDRVDLRGRQARYASIGARLGAGDDVYLGSARASEQYVDAGDGSEAGFDRITTGDGADTVTSGRPGTVSRDVVSLRGGSDVAALLGRTAGVFEGGPGDDYVGISGGPRGAVALDLAAGTLDGGTERARVASFESVQVDMAAFATLRVRGTARADAVRVERRRTAELGRIDIDLGAGDDSVALVARGNLKGRVSLGRGRDTLDVDTGVAFDSVVGPQGAFSGSLGTGVFRVDGHRLRASGVNDLLVSQFRTVRILGSAAPNVIQVQGCRVDARAGDGDDRLNVIGAYACPNDPVTVMRGQAGDDVLHGSEYSGEVLIGGPGRDKVDGGARGGDLCTAEVVRRC